MLQKCCQSHSLPEKNGAHGFETAHAFVGAGAGRQDEFELVDIIFQVR